MAYKIVIDNGKPYEVTAETETELKKVLTEQYAESQKTENPYFDILVYDAENNDISESQFITEMINEITRVGGGLKC